MMNLTDWLKSSSKQIELLMEAEETNGEAIENTQLETQKSMEHMDRIKQICNRTIEFLDTNKEDLNDRKFKTND
jgi:hypothetical protein